LGTLTRSGLRAQSGMKMSETTMQPKSGRAKIRPRARLISLIGDELISDEPVALVELVKNSYDADASRVDVIFVGEDPSEPDAIVVTDNGVGMSLDTVLNAWLEPGTILKKRDERSPGGRLYQGAKGIGRFAAARLGSELLMETKQRGDSQLVSVLLEWGRFDDDSYLDDINVEYDVRAAAESRYGTTLRIEGVRTEIWDTEGYQRLHARLSRLISPFDDVEEFEINLEIPTAPNLSGRVQAPQLVLKPRYMLRGRIDEHGTFNGTLAIEGEETSISRSLARGEEKPECGPFEVEIRGWDRDREGLDPIAHRENMTVTQIRQTLNTYSGVSIYRDGFRVHPYGEAGNDWLNLDLRSRQNPVRNLANNQLIAAIRISRDSNPDLKDRSTREGMIRNSAHAALEDWFKRVLVILEEQRYRVRPRREDAKTQDQLFENFDLKQSVEAVTKELGAKHPVTQIVQAAAQKVDEGVERVQEVLSRLLTSAGLGHMIDIVIHEIGAPAGKITRELLIVEKVLREKTSKLSDEWVGENLTAIRTWLDQIHALRQRLDPQSGSRRQRSTTFDVIKEVESTLGLHDAIIAKQRIKLEYRHPDEPLKVRMPQAVLSQVVANLVDNASYWLTQKHGKTGGGAIQVGVEPLDEGFVVRVSDDGPGVDEQDRELIFDAYFSQKTNGIGLGLYIARLVTEPYGRIIYVADGPLSGACFEARFEKGVGR
jgi:signal transduction histidine kinase